ncbi:hypothetical protein LOAG_02575 [Loa loa]|uniref:Uncharacterized protein n=1 Tax=Loa loa TaxID=7209 RepID=A0A1S0U6Q9_LOALO|nr:hypothetical protein LOAG_02575 [Loa loa]EFO25904.1 hypothetical protein LOAG_02575 [Loa loa]
MGDRNFSDSKRNFNKDRSLHLGRCSSNECNAKHCSRKRNLSFNSNVANEQMSKQSSSEENDELDIPNNFFDEDDDDDNSNTTEEPKEDRSCRNANFNQA